MVLSAPYSLLLSQFLSFKIENVSQMSQILWKRNALAERYQKVEHCRQQAMQGAAHVVMYYVMYRILKHISGSLAIL